MPDTDPHLAALRTELGIDHTTCRTRWAGESCDYAMAVIGLLQATGDPEYPPPPWPDLGPSG